MNALRSDLSSTRATALQRHCPFRTRSTGRASWIRARTSSTQRKDQNETLHEYAFDGLARQVAGIVSLPKGTPEQRAVQYATLTTEMYVDEPINNPSRY